MLQHVFFDRAPRDPLGERRHAQDAHFGVRRPRQPRLAVLLDPGDVLGPDPHRAHQQHVAGCQTDEVLGLRAQVGPLDAVRAVAREDEQRRFDLRRPLQHHLEWFADEDLGLQGDAGILPRHDLGALQVRLAELQEPLVDDVVVQLLLLLELEDFGGLDGEHVLDVVEDDVVVLHVEGAAHVQRGPELLGQL